MGKCAATTVTTTRREQKPNRRQSRTAPGAAPPPAVCCCCCSGGSSTSCLCDQAETVCVPCHGSEANHARHVCRSRGSTLDTVLAEGGDTSTGLVTARPRSFPPYTASLWHRILSRCLCARSPGASSVGVVCACMCVNRRVSMRGFAFSSFCTSFSSSPHPNSTQV